MLSGRSDGVGQLRPGGGLDPVLRPGMVVIPDTVLSDGEVFRADPALAARLGVLPGIASSAATSIAADAQSKRALLAAMGARAIDLESGSVARVAALHGLPFAVVRAICDPAERDLPPAALVALDQAGAIGLLAVLRSVLRRPGQIPGFAGLGPGREASPQGALQFSWRGQWIRHAPGTRRKGQPRPLM